MTWLELSLAAFLKANDIQSESEERSDAPCPPPQLEALFF